MTIEHTLFEEAKLLIERRYPTGWSGAASIRTESGKILTSIAPDTKNDGLSLCMEVGAILEAHKLDVVVTHSLCICREDENSTFVILTPCGICQERLVHWGGDVKAAISNSENELIFKNLRDLQPHHWSIVNGEVL
ncbi:cytidine deaminase [Pseudovibrio ascidiaceicola]|uniref:cytidine deaminase n=1 Tax=Pseudovibrio ascidiaceicola TaxID=285279 RepID=UPI000D69BA0D|nr:cytidine deaminase [Pseudovibrio ascidiaceicola]